jgi:hypothetical protein
LSRRTDYSREINKNTILLKLDIFCGEHSKVVIRKICKRKYKQRKKGEVTEKGAKNQN